MSRAPRKAVALTLLDLRPATIDSQHFETTVSLDAPDFREPWIKMGRATLRPVHRGWLLEARLKDETTDFEHDAAYALRLPLVGQPTPSIYCGYVSLDGLVIPGDRLGDFCVPPDGYNPVDAPPKGAVKCKRCEHKHLILPDGFYVPPRNEALYEQLRGYSVRVEMFTLDAP